MDFSSITLEILLLLLLLCLISRDSSFWVFHILYFQQFSSPDYFTLTSPPSREAEGLVGGSHVATIYEVISLSSLSSRFPLRACNGISIPLGQRMELLPPSAAR